jgi:hypothetical protein
MSKKKDGPPVFRKDNLNFGSSGPAYHLLKKLVSRPAGVEREEVYLYVFL